MLLSCWVTQRSQKKKKRHHDFEGGRAFNDRGREGKEDDHKRQFDILEVTLGGSGFEPPGLMRQPLVWEKKEFTFFRM